MNKSVINSLLPSSIAEIYVALIRWSIFLLVIEASSSFGTDTTPPVISVPSNITVKATSAGGTVVNYPEPTATDDVGVTSLSMTVASFSAPYGAAVDGSGNIYVADRDNDTIRKITSSGVVTTLAGRAGISGSSDGTGSAARFSNPSGVAVDASGNIYLADTGNHTIRKITSSGVVTTLAGSARISGSADGTGSAARFNNPSGVAVDASGNVYVADASQGTIRKVSSSAVVTTVAGSFAGPSGIAVDGSGNIYVAGTDSCVIRKISSSGAVAVLAGSDLCGSADGTGSAATFFSPFGVAVDATGNIYVADTTNNIIRKITSSGVVTTLAGRALISGSSDGSGRPAMFNYPNSVAVDGSGNIYVADTRNNAIRKITTSGVVSTFAGSAASFSNPCGVAVDGNGNVYVADTGNNTIRKITSSGVVTTLAGSAGISGSADGTGSAASFYNPWGVAVDGSGNVYVADAYNHTIRKITSSGVVTTLAGRAGTAGSSDGTGSAASFHYPLSMAVDGSGNVYVADTYNHTIRKITSSGVVTLLAGRAGAVGSSDGSGSAASFYYPNDVAVDGSGNIYVADTNNNTIRKITSSGVVTTLAGGAGSSGSFDGTGSAARLKFPAGVAVDRSGNVYVADTNNATIRKIMSGGVVTTLAGVPLTMGNVDGATQYSGSIFPIGTTSVTYTALDAAANASVASFTVTVAPSGAPVVTVPSNITVEATSASGAIVTYPAATATDSVTTNPTITYSKASGTVFPLGTTTVTVTATDGANNVASSTFTVTVNPRPNPTLTTPPANISTIPGAACSVAIQLSNTVNAVRTSYQILQAGTTAPIGRASIVSSGTGAFYVPLRSIYSSGNYQIVFTRTFLDGTSDTVTSDPFSVNVTSWNSAAGLYDGILIHNDGNVGDSAVSRGRVTFSLSRFGSFSGNIQYTEAELLSGGSLLSPPPRTHVPVTRAFSGVLTPIPGESLKFSVTKTLGLGAAAGREQLQLSADLSVTPPVITATVTDHVTITPDVNASGVRSVASLTRLPLMLTRGSAAGIAGQYILSANNGNTESNKSYILAQVMPSGRIIWTSRCTGYNGSGSSIITVSDTQNTAVFYQANFACTSSQLTSTVLMGRLNFISSGSETSTWAPSFGGPGQPDGVEKFVSKVPVKMISSTLTPYYDDAKFGLGTAFTKRGLLDFSNHDGLKWTSSNVVTLPTSLLSTNSLVLSLDGPSGDPLYTWSVIVSANGATTVTGIPDSNGVLPPQIRRFTLNMSRGEWNGSFRTLDTDTSVSLFGAVTSQSNTPSVQSVGWSETGVLPNQTFQAWTLK